MPQASALVFLFLSFTVSVSGQASADFAGHWSRQTDSGSQRHLEIGQNGRKLRVKTQETSPEGTRHIDVTYEIGGPETTYTGLDGDEFHASVHWDGKSLVFEIVEHENGSEIPQRVVWTLSEDSNTLRVDRSLTKSGQTKHSLTEYIREH
jgi:hypothetical protein